MVDTELVSTIIEPEMKAVADQLFSDKSKMITPEQIADANKFQFIDEIA